MKYIKKEVRNFLNKAFCVVGRNSPYQVNDFVNVLLDAVEHNDFTNNTCIRVGGPTGETVFSRLNKTKSAEIENAFCCFVVKNLQKIKILLRNRKIIFSFDMTDEPYYGKIEGKYIHTHKPVQGSTGCFRFLTVTAKTQHENFILGSLPFSKDDRVHESVIRLIKKIKKHIRPDLLLFDRGFESLKLIKKLQKEKIKFQILWANKDWAKKIFQKMQPRELKNIQRKITRYREKPNLKLQIQFTLIKEYTSSIDGRPYNWVFATNTKPKDPETFIKKYKKRWNIETTFRVLDNIQIKTTTKNEVIRYFINIFCCLIYNLWKLENFLEEKITLKNFVSAINKEIKITISEKTAPKG